MASHGDVEAQDAPPIDIKSRIAAFNKQADATSGGGGAPRPPAAKDKAATVPRDVKEPEAVASSSNGPRLTVPPLPGNKPGDGARVLRKTPSTSQLLSHNWQKQGEEQQQQKTSSSSQPPSPAMTAASPRQASGGVPPRPPSRPRASTGAAATPSPRSSQNEAQPEPDTPRLDVKNIIALYGGAAASDKAASNIAGAKAPPSPPANHSVSSVRHLLDASEQTSSMSMITSLAPQLPERPKEAESKLSSRASDTGLGKNLHLPSRPPQAMRSLPARPLLSEKTSASSLASNASSAASDAPRLPPRKSWAARSSDDLFLHRGASTGSSESLPQPSGRGFSPKWPNSSNVDLRKDYADRDTSQEGSTLLKGTGTTNTPAPPPRHRSTRSAEADGSAPSPNLLAPASAFTAARQRQSSSSSPLGLRAPTGSPSPSSSPSRAHLKDSNTARAVPAASSSISGGRSSPAGLGDSLAASSTASPKIGGGSFAPPPRHVDALRGSTLGPRSAGALARGSNPAHSPHRPGYSSSQRPRRQKRRQRSRPLAAARPTQDFACEPASAAARARYETLFDQKLAEQKASAVGAQSNGARSEHRTLRMGSIRLRRDVVVRLWRRSRLDSAFLGRVWAEASSPDQEEQRNNSSIDGVPRPAFVQAMSAIDAELERRRRKQ